jgi:hypothetical protein
VDLLEVSVRPSGGIAFHVQDEEGDPIENAEVVLRSQSYPIGSISWNDSPIGVGASSPFRTRLTTRTNDNGDARIDNLPSDGGKIEWSAYISLSNWRSEKIKGLHALGKEPQRVVLKRDVLVHAVTGKVLDPAGHPVVSAIVRCGKIGCRPDQTTGQYRIDLPGIPSSDLGSLDARATGYVSTIQANWNAPEDPFVADFVLSTASGIAGTVTDSRGQPIRGVSLWLKRGPSGGRIPTTSDEKGSFHFPAIVDDDLTLSSEPLDTGLSAWRSCEMSVEPGAQDVRMVLEPDLDPPRGTLHARIVDEQTGAPAPVLDVQIVPDSSHMMVTRCPPRARIVRKVGDLSVRGLSDCSWRAWVVSSEGRVARFDFDITSDHRDLEIEIPIGPLRSIAGRVNLNGKPFLPPVGGERVRAWAVMPEESYQPSIGAWREAHVATRRDVHLDSDGTFQIEGLVPGTYLVMVRGAGIECSADVVLGVHEDAEVVLDAKRDTDTPPH